jgi:hydroxymethylpyrimidine/phosphomethylpyrimidine kinase
VDAHDEVVLRQPRLAVPNTHGTGCTFAAAIAARLALGDPLDEATRSAKQYVTGAMRHGIAVGSGHQPLGHFWQPL